MANQTDAVVITIAGSAGIRDIADIHERVLTALQTDGSVVLDLARADDPDITFLQLVEAARRYAAAAGKHLTLKQPAGADLQNQLERGGFLSRDTDRAFWLESAENFS